MPFHLALATQIGFEFGEDTEHVEEGFACGSAGVDRLFGRLERGARGFERSNDVLHGRRSSGRDDRCEQEPMSGMVEFGDGLAPRRARRGWSVATALGVGFANLWLLCGC